MKKKSFFIIIAMLLVVIGFGIIQNVTVANAATIGTKLATPETGWTRYDDADSKFQYNGNWVTCTGSTSAFYLGANHTLSSGEAGSVKFNFYGSKFRVIMQKYTTRSTSIIVNVDGTDIGTYSINGSALDQCLLYEKTDLDLGKHTVILTQNDTTKNFCFDAIDIDDNGQLLSYYESISLDNSSINLSVGDLKKLTATTTPANADIVWTSSDESIAIVDSEGNVTARKEGQATISAIIANTELKATCEVNVTTIVNNSNAILSISLVDGNTKEYDISMSEVDKFINWYENRDDNSAESPKYMFDKNISPYKSVKEYLVHDKIVSYEVREY
jgi:uncharacterized protein YjdB